MGNVKKLRKDLKDRIAELKYVLKMFNKEIKILTRNKKKALKKELKRLNAQKEEEISQKISPN